MRASFRWLSAALFVAVVLQVAFAAFGAFDAVHKADHVAITKKAIENGFSVHAILGTLIVILMLALLIIAAAGRLGPTQVRLAAVILGLGIVQMLLGFVSTSAPILGLLHGINALAIFATTGALAHRTWAPPAGETPGAGAAVQVG